jgi:hypothetical protein
MLLWDSHLKTGWEEGCKMCMHEVETWGPPHSLTLQQGDNFRYVLGPQNKRCGSRKICCILGSRQLQEICWPCLGSSH